MNWRSQEMNRATGGRARWEWIVLGVAAAFALVAALWRL